MLPTITGSAGWQRQGQEITVVFCPCFFVKVGVCNVVKREGVPKGGGSPLQRF
jgi:hypothetical protein